MVFLQISTFVKYGKLQSCYNILELYNILVKALFTANKTELGI